MKFNFLAVLFAAYSVQVLAAGPVVVNLKNAKGEAVGTATLTDIAKGVKIALELHGLPPGEHAFHVHDKGVCTPPKFDSAGGHFNPGKQEHGFDNKHGFHDGDMSNVIVGADGKASVEIINTTVSIDSGPNALLNKNGNTALVLHEKADDYKSQPAGNAGARLACGEIKI